MQVTAETSNRIKNLGLFCSLLVVVIHVWRAPISNPIGWAITDLIQPGVTGMAVPFFFAVSGYFLAGHIGVSGWYVGEWKKRVLSLLIPMFAWNLTWMVGRLVVAVCSDGVLSPSEMWLEDVTCHGAYPRPLLFNITGGWLSAIGLNPFAFPAMIQFWYLRALFLLVVLSPLLLRLATNCGLVMVLAVYGSLCPFVVGEYSDLDVFLRSTISLEGVFYFTVGMYLRQHPVKLNKWKAVSIIIMAIITVVAGSWCRCHGLLIAGNWLRWVSLPFVLISFWILTPTVCLPSWLTSCAFPIYLAHILVIRSIDAVSLPLDGLGPVASWGLKICIAVLISIGFSVIFRRLFPKVSRFYLGGRC